MKILILGGTGAIGTPLIAILRQNQDIQIVLRLVQSIHQKKMYNI